MPAPVITGFSSKVFFPNAEHEDADHASLAAGTSTVTTPGPDGDSQWLGRRVFLPEEMMHPRRHPLLGRPVTMLLADARAFQIYLPPSYRLRELAPVLKKHSRRRLRTRRRHPLTYTKTAAGRGFGERTDEPAQLVAPRPSPGTWMPSKHCSAWLSPHQKRGSSGRRGARARATGWPACCASRNSCNSSVPPCRTTSMHAANAAPTIPM
jgi:hypothetical protein